MKIKFIVCILILVIVGTYTSCSSSTNKQTIHIPEGVVGMVGYGSLMSRQSMESTLARAYEDSIYLIHLKGYQREWNWHLSLKDTRLPESYSNRDWFYIRDNDTISFNNVIALNIMLSENNRMNCVLYFITPDELAGFDEREIGYERIDVTDMIEEYNFTGGRVYSFKALSEYAYQPEIQREGSILDIVYVEKVTNACDSIGVDFRKEFEESTIHYDPELVAPIIWKKVR